MSQFAPVGLRVPSGFEQLLESLAKEILRVQPSDIISFAADYFKLKLAQREERNNRFSENGLHGNMEVVKDMSRYDKYPDVMHTMRQEATAESRASDSPPPCSDDDHDDPNYETAAQELLGSEKLGSTHSVIEDDIEPNLDATEDGPEVHDPDLEKKSPLPSSDLGAAESVPNNTEIPSDDIDEQLSQVPDSNIIEEIAPKSDQGSPPPAGSDPDLARSPPADQESLPPGSDPDLARSPPADQESLPPGSDPDLARSPPADQGSLPPGSDPDLARSPPADQGSLPPAGSDTDLARSSSTGEQNYVELPGATEEIDLPENSEKQ